VTIDAALLCCCDPSPCARTCDFGSSYLVSGIAGSYSFSRQQAPQGCGQVCFTRSFTITVNWQQLGPIVVTRQTSSGGFQPCSYGGQGTVVVTGTLTITEIYAGGICPDQVQEYSYSFANDVPCAVTLTCGLGPACSFATAGNAPGWNHTLHICDFPITCSHEGIGGDCDSCPEPFGPFSLWCVGGTVSYLSDIISPDAIVARGCLGFYKPGTTVFPTMAANSAIAGPFGVMLSDECGGQDLPLPCTLGVGTAAFLSTRVDTATFTPWFDEPSETTKSPCASTDWSGGPSSSCTISIIQGGCGIPWQYS
jgi:hypothetical protein